MYCHFLPLDSDKANLLMLRLKKCWSVGVNLVEFECMPYSSRRSLVDGRHVEKGTNDSFIVKSHK